MRRASISTFKIIDGKLPVEVLADNPRRTALIFQVQALTADDWIDLRFSQSGGAFPLRGRPWLGGGVGVDNMQNVIFEGGACPQSSVWLSARTDLPAESVVVTVIEVVE